MKSFLLTVIYLYTLIVSVSVTARRAGSFTSSWTRPAGYPLHRSSSSQYRVNISALLLALLPFYTYAHALVTYCVLLYSRKVYALYDASTNTQREMIPFDTPKTDLTFTLLFSWIVTFLCIFKGIKSSGKVKENISHLGLL